MDKVRDAIKLLGREKDIRALEPLNHILSEEKYSEVWADSIEALGEIGDTRSLGLIRERLNSGSWEIKWRASGAICEIIESSSPDDGLEILLELLENDEWIVRFEAAQSLSQFKEHCDSDEVSWTKGCEVCRCLCERPDCWYA